MKNREQQLATFSYLWTSGEWKLYRSNVSRARLIIAFPAGRPSLRELLAVRALVPRFMVEPVSVLKAEVGALAEFEVGEFGNFEARSLEKAARAAGLQVRVEDTSRTDYFPMSNDQMGLIIEDNELAELVVAEMLRRGVPVVHVEAD